MKMIELPPLASNSKTNLIVNSDKQKPDSSLFVRMNSNKQTSYNMDSSASSTSNSRSQSSCGLLIKRTRTSNNLGQDNRLGPLFEQKSLSPLRRLQRASNSHQRLSNPSDYGSTVTGPARSNNATLASQSTTRRCASTNDLTKTDKNNNKNRQGLITRSLNKHKSDQKMSERKKTKKETDDVLNNAEETDDAREKRILDWLVNVEKFAEAPPEIDVDEPEAEPEPPQTDTAIHIVYEGARRGSSTNQTASCL